MGALERGMVVSEARSWWGEYAIPEDRAGRWVIGALGLSIEHRLQEWVVASFQEPGDPEGRLEVDCPIVPEPPRQDAIVNRFVSRKTEQTLWLRPMLADRPVVVRPEIPLHVLPGESVVIYLSTALWVQVEVGEKRRLLMELPTNRPSDTWFGENTRDGEICYASRTSARINLENLLRDPARIITSVTLRNLASDNLLLERFKLPVPALSVYQDEGLNLWTQSVTVERAKDGKLAEIRMGDEAPSEATGPSLVSKPRNPEENNVLVWALNTFMR